MGRTVVRIAQRVVVRPVAYKAFTPLATAGNVTHVQHLYVLRTSFRTELAEYLDSCGISHAVHYPNLDYEQVGFEAKSEMLPNSEALKTSIISLPLFPELRNNEIEAVINALVNFSPKSL